jgi:hypothetical protein
VVGSREPRLAVPRAVAFSVRLSHKGFGVGWAGVPQMTREAAENGMPSLDHVRSAEFVSHRARLEGVYATASRGTSRVGRAERAVAYLCRGLLVKGGTWLLVVVSDCGWCGGLVVRARGRPGLSRCSTLGGSAT